MKWLPRPRFIHVSPWFFAAATALLVLIVVTFAASNISREKRLMMGAMLQKASILNRVIQSGARASYIADLRRGIWKPEPWQDHIGRVIAHVAEDPDLIFISVISSKGEIVADSRPDRKGTHLAQMLPDDMAGKTDRGHYVYRIAQQEGKRYLEVIRRFVPFQPFLPGIPLSLQELHKRFTMPFGPGALPASPETYYMIIGLDMTSYDKALRRLRFQVVMLSLAMLLVGVGGWLSLAAVQGYRVSRKALQDIQAFTSLLISRLPVGIVAVDNLGRITTWNRAIAQILDLSAEQAIGKDLTTVLPQELVDFFKNSQSCARCGEDPGSCEIRLRRENETMVLNCYHLHIDDHSGQPRGEVLLVTNVTALKNLEKEMRETERLAAVGRMAAGVAHEVRNPLSSVKGLAILLQRKFAPGSSDYETASLLVQEVERINRTISELLSFARPAPLDLARVDVGELLARQVRILAADTASQHINIRLDLADDLYPVAADQDRLNQVFVNILLNAFQAMDEGELTVTARNSTDRRNVIVTVTDSGAGMEREVLAQAFFPYFTTKADGTGIGLALSQKVINDHGGTISIRSSPGQGTTVTVVLPRWMEMALGQ